MHIRHRDRYDVVGIGFGPSNLALAIALEEYGNTASERTITSAFFEKQPTFGWHRNMLLPGTTMQVSFLKDLASFRNPTSRYSFVSYLHEVGRLARFVNNQDFFPTRKEFHDYLQWSAAKITQPVSYSCEVVAVHRSDDLGPWLELDVREADGSLRQVLARNVVISTGLTSVMPGGIVPGEKVWHSSEFLHRFNRADAAGLRRIAVVGAGQSAAEIARFLYDELPHAEVCAILPSYGYSIADDTPFANQVFDAPAVDDYYHADNETRERFWRYHRNTNYSVVDDETIRSLYRRSYDESVQNTNRLQFLNLTRVLSVYQENGQLLTRLRPMLESGTRDLPVDAIVFATGYASMDPVSLLGDLAPLCLRDASGRLQIGRDYRVATVDDLTSGVYLQGGTEQSHGLTSSLLSNIAVRSGEIVESIARHLLEQELEAEIELEAGARAY